MSPRQRRLPREARRARKLVAHHEERPERPCAALRDGRPRTAYDVSLALFPDPLPSPLRRFALAESRAHVDYLALRGEIERVVGDELTRYGAIRGALSEG